MLVKELHMKHFRNYADQRLTLTDGVNVLIGENAQGKTNALEAIYLLAIGKSHRTAKDTDYVMWGTEECSIEATVQLRERDRRLRIELGPSGKKAQVNGVNQAKMTDFIGHFQVVLFAPEDLGLVKGGPAVRRRFIDMELGQTQKKYLYHLSNYARTMQQRNTLLKREDVDFAYIEVFDEQLVEHGVQVLLRRFKFMEQMRQLADNIYQTISNNREQLRLSYDCSVSTTLDQSHVDQAELAERYRKALVAKRNSDRHLGYTTVGPHRDDVSFYLNDKPVQSHASQGQQRTIALSMRLAEIDFIHAEVGEYPVLLLDDVLSELDNLRQKNLVLSMSEKVQTIITTTSLFQMNDRLRVDGRLFHVDSGIIQEEG